MGSMNLFCITYDGRVKFILITLKLFWTALGYNLVAHITIDSYGVRVHLQTMGISCGRFDSISLWSSSHLPYFSQDLSTKYIQLISIDKLGELCGSGRRATKLMMRIFIFTVLCEESFRRPKVRWETSTPRVGFVSISPRGNIYNCHSSSLCAKMITPAMSTESSAATTKPLLL